MIGYYVHHHGSGHMNRAHSIAARLGEPVTVLSSQSPGPDHAAAEWLRLPLDIDDAPRAEPDTANGAFHWAPIGIAGLTHRMAALAEWVSRFRPVAVIVDVSVEVSVFVRLMGVPVVVMAMPGNRDDDAHQLGYRVADLVIAPWSQQIYDPSWLHQHANKTVYVGAISRFDGRPRPADTHDSAGDSAGGGTVVILGGAGGSSVVAEDVRIAAETVPHMTWTAAGVHGTPWIDDVWPTLCTATVVVTHAGQNAVADLACAARPAIVLPQQRPFDEQICTAGALSDARIAETIQSWPKPHEWPTLVDRARRTDTSMWAALNSAGSAQRAADAVMTVTRRA